MTGCDDMASFISVLRSSPAPAQAREAIRTRVSSASKVIDDNGILIEPSGGSTDVSFDSMRGYVLKFSVSVVSKAESKANIVLEGVEEDCLLFEPADIGTRQIELHASQWEHLKTLSKCFFTPPVEARVQLSIELTGRGTSFSGRLIGFGNQEVLRANIESATESAVRELF